LVRKNLGMSPGKVAAQAVHAALGLNEVEHSRVVVLEVSDKQFALAADARPCHVVVDAGVTEVSPGTTTALAYWED